jgi:hypothetical protein
MSRACSTYEGGRRMHIGSWGKARRKEILGRRRRRWEDNIKIDHKNGME